MNSVLGAYFQRLLRRQARMNDSVPMVLARIIIESRLQGMRRLVECRIANGMHFNLKPQAIRLFAEIGHEFVAVV